jgi:acetyl esterase/lipase
MKMTSTVAILPVPIVLLTSLLFAIPLRAQQTSPPASENQDPSAQPVTMPLWEGKAPGALGDTDSDRPTLTLYAPWTGHPPNPGNPPTPAVIVFPGGSYEFLASNHEGRQMANFLNAMGITAFVVKYRLGPRYHHPVELGDAQRAFAWCDRVRKNLAYCRTKSAFWDFPQVAIWHPLSRRISIPAIRKLRIESSA